MGSYICSVPRVISEMTAFRDFCGDECALLSRVRFFILCSHLCDRVHFGIFFWCDFLFEVVILRMFFFIAMRIFDFFVIILLLSHSNRDFPIIEAEVNWWLMSSLWLSSIFQSSCASVLIIAEFCFHWCSLVALCFEYIFIVLGSWLMEYIYFFYLRNIS
jgi:hypothetical protein